MDHHRPPPPTGQVLSLISALSNTQNHELHVQAIRARDQALSASLDSYSNLCVQLALVLVGCDEPQSLLSKISPHELQLWEQTDRTSILRLQQDASLWIPFGQMAGLILKNALLRPPAGPEGRIFSVQTPMVQTLQETLLFSLSCKHAELRKVGSSIIATSAVSTDSLQPALHVRTWTHLLPTLIDNLQQHSNRPAALVEGSLMTIRKMMEDGPDELSTEQLDRLVPVLIRHLSPSSSSPNSDRQIVAALQSMVACLTVAMPNALVLHFADYLAALSTLAVHTNPSIRQWVCRTMVTLLEVRTEYISDHLASVCQFMAASTHDVQHSLVALEACEFWLVFATLPSEQLSVPMLDTVQNILPQLVPILVQCMVYNAEQQAELLMQNELDQQEQVSSSVMKPVFHKSRAKHAGDKDHDNDDKDDNGDDDDDDDDDDEDGNEWTLRKCAAASLDTLASLYGADPILPSLLPVLEEGLKSADPWVQEASILALGAIAEGCGLEMSAHMAQLHPFLMNILSMPEGPNTLPQLKSICAWTIGRYVPWAVEQVQTGVQGHLLAQMTEIFMLRLGDRNRKVQVACCSAFGVMVETAGDLMAPYLEPIYQTLVSAMERYQGRSLLTVFDVLGIMADFCGPAIAEGNLPSIYVPPLLRMWDGLAKNDPTDRTLLPLMECLASVAITSGMNYQPYAMESFENAMGLIEAVTLILATSGESLVNEEETDPIICATDWLDGLVEGLGPNFQALVQNSQRFGQHFLNVLLSLCQHEIGGVRMSALALLGDLARNAPSLLEPALPQLLQEAIASMDPVRPSVSTNAVWAIGEICVRCEGNGAPLKPYAPSLMQNLIMLLMGNGTGGANGWGTDIPGLAENAAACVGRLAKVDPDFVAPELPRFLLGWCDAMAKITDPVERRDAFQGFIKTVYANPQAIQNATTNIAEAIVSILFCIVTWHLPLDLPDQSTLLLDGDYNFRPFPTQEAELGASLVRLVQDMKASVGEETWHSVQKSLPVNVRRLLRDGYNL